MAICWLILGSVICIWSATFPFGTRTALGPAILPFASGLILILLGSLLFFHARRQKDRKRTENFDSLIPRGEAFTRVAFTLGAMSLCALFLEVLGFPLAIFCLSLFLIRVIQPQKWKVDVFYVLVFTIGSYLLFKVLLKTTLPRGFLGF